MEFDWNDKLKNEVKIIGNHLLKRCPELLNEDVLNTLTFLCTSVAVFIKTFIKQDFIPMCIEDLVFKSIKEPFKEYFPDEKND